MKTIILSIAIVFYLLISRAGLQAQERFEIIAGKKSHTISIVKVAGESQLKPFIVELVYELEPKGKEKKQTNVINFEINQLEEIWLYGSGALDSHYGFKNKINNDRSLNIEWFPTALPSKITLAAPLKKAFLSIKYRGKSEANIDVNKSGSFQVKYFNAAGVNEYTYVFNYSEKRTIVAQILKNGKKANLNPTVENKARDSDILGQILKIKMRNVQ